MNLRPNQLYLKRKRDDSISLRTTLTMSHLFDIPFATWTLCYQSRVCSTLRTFWGFIPKWNSTINTTRFDVRLFHLTGLLVKFKHLHWQLTIDIRILEHIRALLNKYIERTKLIHSFIYSQWYNCFRRYFDTIDSFQCHYTEYVCFPCLKIIFHTINYATGSLTLTLRK